jgi:hypothetical protein
VQHALHHLEHFFQGLINSKDFWQAAIVTTVGATIAAAIGAYVGGRMATGAALKTQEQAAKDQRERDAEADRRSIHGTLRAIAGELRVLQSQALEHQTKPFEDHERARKSSEVQLFPFAITHTNPNRFTIFDSNSGKLGRIQDDHLIEHIVSVYSKAKELVDQANAAARDFERWLLLPEGDPEKAMVRNMLNGLEAGIHEGLPNFRSDVDKLLNEIDEYLKLEKRELR